MRKLTEGVATMKASIMRRRVLVPLSLLVLFGVGGVFVASRPGQGSAQSANGCDAPGYPFQSIPCDLYQDGSHRAALADPATQASVPVTADEATAAAARLNPGSKFLETRLIQSWSRDSSDPARDRKLLWAVSSLPADGPFISGGAFLMKEAGKLRATGDTRPLTPDEMATVSAAVDADIAAARAAITQMYHVDFIDPRTGAYVGAVEGTR